MTSSICCCALILLLATPIWGQGQVSLPQAQPPASSPAAPPGQPLTSPGLSQSGYLLGSGDTVRAIVWTGNEYLQDNLVVAADGTMFIPFFINRLMAVTGMTTAQLREVIQSELQVVFQKPVVQLITVGFESQKAFLLGEVVGSGQFSVFGNTRILDFVVQHGGFSQRANLAEVQVTRADGKKLAVNIYDIVLSGNQTNNILVSPGDMVYVPSLEQVSKRYFVLGEVRAPQMVQSQTDLNILEAISRAGTLDKTAQAKKIFLVRQNSGGPEVQEINFENLYRKADFSQNVPLKSGDIVYVPKNARTRVSDVLSAINPVIQFVRDTAFLGQTLR